MIKVFNKFDTEFNTNGLQILDDSIIDSEVYEVMNGIYSLTFKYPIFRTKYLEEENIITAPTPKNGEQPFRISKVNKELGYYNITAYHIFYDLSDNLIEDINIVNNGGRNAIGKIAEGGQYKHPFNMYSDIDTVNNCRIVRYNIVQALLDSSKDNTFISRWGGEIERNSYSVTMRKKLGTDRGIQIRYKKNLVGYEADIDYTQIATRIMPKGFDGLLLPEKYVDSDNIVYYPHPKIRIIEYGDIKAINEDSEGNDEGAVPLEEAYKLLREAAQREYSENHVDIPFANYKVDFVELSSTEEYKNIQVLEKVYLGDTVTVIHEEENLNINARVISYKYDPLTKKYTELELGNYQKSFTDITNKIKDLDNKIDDTGQSMLDAAKEHATDLINTGFGGHVRIHPDRILIMDTEEELTAQNVWQWNKNGLGFSSTGINGPYGLAMTKDGSIVADFITTGVLNANVITAGALKGKNFNLDLDSGLMEFGIGAITSETLTEDLKEELKGEDGRPGIDGQDGQDGTNATLPYWWQEWNGTTTTISGNYTITPRLYVGSTTKGIFFGNDCVKDSSGNWLSGLVGYWNPDVTFHLKPDGSLTLGNKPDRQFKVDSSGNVTMPKLQVGEVTTDVLLPGTSQRIVMEPGYSPGDNNCMSIDTNTGAIRLKKDDVNYVRVDRGVIDFYLSRYSYSIRPYDAQTVNFNNMFVQNSGGIAIKAGSGSSSSYLRLFDNGGISSYVNGTGYNHVSISDINQKENVEYIDNSEKLINANEENFVNLGINKEDVYNFIRKDLKLCQYNFNDEYYQGEIAKNKLKFGFIAQDIMDTKVGKLIFNSGNFAYEVNNYISVIAGALQVEIQKREDLEVRVAKLEELLLNKEVLK
ncbi:phage tail protein [Clostridioides mangenotii]|uniref:phage tail spike protein n=1 Tax=Metaclostridioides mangenotii TaxID=1540 RepID=UPI00214A0F5D|nr:phage tail spike protein [Clostridioides mangenotii]MCR1955227.1 phage tail protein [Clostridioides mangenotii]